MDITLLDAVISLTIVYVFVLPRFNQWPQENFNSPRGHPKNHLSRGRYFLFSAAYVFSFLMFAYSVRQLGLLVTLLDRGSTGANNLMCIVSALLIGGIKLIPQLGQLDDRWRGYLLTLARTPKDTLDIKQIILTGLQQQLPRGERMEALINHLKGHDVYGCWREFDIRNPGFGLQNELKSLIVKNIYLVHVIRCFDVGASDSQDLIAAEELAARISARLPSLDPQDNAEFVFQYKIQLDKSLNTLAEMLARNIVQTHSKRTIQLAKMKFLGLETSYTDQHDMKLDILKPATTIVLGLLVINFFLIAFGLLLIDGFKITAPSHMEGGFDLPRAFHWSLDLCAAFTIAIFFGCFFHATLAKRSKSATLAYFLAFFFSALGSGFSVTHFWLSIYFGLMAIITIKSGAMEVSSNREIQKRVHRMALVYASAVAVLLMPTVMALPGLEAFEVLDTLVWFVFGFATGYCVAFLVAYTLLNYHTRKSFEGRRKSARIPYYKRIIGRLDDVEMEMLVNDISHGGALVRFPEGQMPAVGQTLVLDFDFSPIPGVIIWVTDGLARLRFDTTAPGATQLKTQLQNSIPADYLMVMAA